MSLDARQQLLPDFQNFAAVWMEITKSEHQHGGVGWDFGTCLWSPTRNARGARSYEVMKRPSVGDLVLHNYHFTPPDGRKAASYLCGWSVVAVPANTLSTEPPSAGDWSGRQEYYRIDLRDFAWLPTLLPISEFVTSYGEELRGELTYHKPEFIPFTINDGQVRLNQGMYPDPSHRGAVRPRRSSTGNGKPAASGRRVARCRTSSIRRRGTDAARADRIPEEPLSSKRRQASRLLSMRVGFRRKALTETNIWKCRSNAITSCRLRSEKTSHLRIARWEDVVTLCSNCHRFVHSSRKLLTLEQARKVLGRG